MVDEHLRTSQSLRSTSPFQSRRPFKCEEYAKKGIIIWLGVCDRAIELRSNCQGLQTAHLRRYHH